MVPESFAPFFSTAATAGAALAGLLFLAVTVGTIPTVGHGAPVERRSVAACAFSALINGFFISLGALVPGANVGVSALVVGILSLVVMVVIGRDLAVGQPALARARRLALVLLGAVLYALECWRGLQLLRQPDESGPISALATLLVVVYAVAILRAWELVGAERYGMLGRLSPLRDLDDDTHGPGATAPRPRPTR